MRTGEKVGICNGSPQVLFSDDSNFDKIGSIFFTVFERGG